MFIFQLGDVPAHIAWVAMVHENQNYDFNEITPFTITPTKVRSCTAKLDMTWHLSERSDLFQMLFK